MHVNPRNSSDLFASVLGLLVCRLPEDKAYLPHLGPNSVFHFSKATVEFKNRKIIAFSIFTILKQTYHLTYQLKRITPNSLELPL
jgi:hypothetical protein